MLVERHVDWAVIIALVGGGQEINRGERGLAEWGLALNERRVSGSSWEAIAAPEVLTGGDSTAWQSLFPGGASPDWLARDERLHLATSIRSYLCLTTTQWVNAVLEGRIGDAHKIAAARSDFPLPHEVTYRGSRLVRARHSTLWPCRKFRCSPIARRWSSFLRMS